MRTLTQGPHSVCYEGSWLYLETIIIHKQAMFFHNVPQVLEDNIATKFLLV